MMHVYGILTKNNTALFVKGHDNIWRLPSVHLKEKVEDIRTVVGSLKIGMKNFLHVDVEPADIAYQHEENGSKHVFLKIKNFSGKLNEGVETNWMEFDRMNKTSIDILPSHKNAVFMSTLKE